MIIPRQLSQTYIKVVTLFTAFNLFLQPEHLHRIAVSAGCHMYAPADCTVYGDSRFIGIFPRTELKDAKLVFREKVSFESTVSGRKERSVKSITMNLKAKEMEFFIYN